MSKKLTLHINDHQITCDLALTPAEHTLGLQKYASLQEDTGLLFVFPHVKSRTFHMGSVSFPIDIVGLDQHSRVTRIVHDATPGSNETWTLPRVAAVLELNGGACRRLGVETGNVVMTGGFGFGREAKAYHGTPALFEKLEHDRSGLGTHFGTESAARARLKDTTDEDTDPDRRVIKYELDVKHPLRLFDVGDDWNSIRAIYNVLRDEAPDIKLPSGAITWKVIRDAIQSAGYDSVIYKNEIESPGSTSYIVWDDSKIHQVESRPYRKRFMDYNPLPQMDQPQPQPTEENHIGPVTASHKVADGFNEYNDESEGGINDRMIHERETDSDVSEQYRDRETPDEQFNSSVFMSDPSENSFHEHHLDQLTDQNYEPGIEDPVMKHGNVVTIHHGSAGASPWALPEGFSVEVSEGEPDDWAESQVPKENEAFIRFDLYDAAQQRVAEISATLIDGPERRVMTRGATARERRKGYGRMLYRYILQWAKKHNAWVRPHDAGLMPEAAKAWEHVSKDDTVKSRDFVRTRRLRSDPEVDDPSTDWSPDRDPHLFKEYREACYRDSAAPLLHKTSQIVDEAKFVERMTDTLFGKLDNLQWTPDALNGGATERLVLDRSTLASLLSGDRPGSTSQVLPENTEQVLNAASTDRGLQLIGDSFVLAGLADFSRLGYKGRQPTLVLYRQSED